MADEPRERKVDWNTLFSKVHDSDVRLQLKRIFAWDAAAWAKFFQRFSANRDTDGLKALRYIYYYQRNFQF